MSEHAPPASVAPSVQERKQLDVVKCHDDQDPVLLELASAPGDNEVVLAVSDASPKCSWASKGQPISMDKLRKRVEPWLTALFQSDHLSVLLGAGLSYAVHHRATGKAPPGMSVANFKEFSAAVSAEAQRTAAAAGRGKGNFEDQLRVANELLRGLQVLGGVDDSASKQASSLQDTLDTVMAAFGSSILEAERSLNGASEANREDAFNYLVSFLMSFASRTGTRDRLHIFTTNYDRYIEAGAELAGLHLLDRFVGTLAPVFRSSRLDIDVHYNPPGIRGEPRYLEGVVRFTKLHGSLDWIDAGAAIRRIALPFGATKLEPFLSEGVPCYSSARPPSHAGRLMVFPNSAKDRETAAYPYVELFRDLAAAIARPNHTLVTFGYSFGDEHINRVIQDMLTIPSTHLVVISFDDPLDRIMATYKRIGKPAQMTLLIGSHVGEFGSLVDNFLPKPAIDRTTFRMAELLKARWRPFDGEVKAEAPPAAEIAEGATA